MLEKGFEPFTLAYPIAIRDMLIKRFELLKSRN
jgi:hypothetical protein